MNKSEAKKAFERAAIVPLGRVVVLFGEEAAENAANIAGTGGYIQYVDDSYNLSENDEEIMQFLNYRGFMTAAKFAHEKEKRQ